MAPDIQLADAWVAAHDSDREACSDLFIQADLDKKELKNRSLMHTFGSPWLFSPLLPARTALFPSFQSCLAFIHIAPCFNIHNSICLKQTSPASFSHLLRYCSNVTYSMKNALIPQGIQCSLLVFAIVPCIDLHSLNKYWPLSQSLSKPARRGVRLLILGIPHSSCRPCCEQRPLELCLWWPSETQSTSSLTFLLLWYPSGRRTKWPFWSK